METNLVDMLLKERIIVAEELQNEINQSLASVLLWIQFAVKEHHLQEDKSLQQAQNNLRATINRARALHYSLSKDLPRIA
jgi:signal transduction histidine kinase